MASKLRTIIYWSPRIFGLLFAFFIGLFATEIFNRGYSLSQTIIGILIQLIPAIIILVFTYIGWQKSYLGAMLFFILGFIYIIRFDNLSFAAYALIPAPLFFISLLFLLSSLFPPNKMKEKSPIKI